jgi:hypothetical protein
MPGETVFADAPRVTAARGEVDPAIALTAHVRGSG